MRRLCARRREALRALDARRALRPFVEPPPEGPIAPSPDLPNRQHYELPPAFFRAVLGPRMKYSCGFWQEDTPDLAAAERAALRRTADHADLQGADTLLDLGCGWGSFALWVAQRHPGLRVSALSNSAAQGAFIRRAARERDLGNLEVVTADVGDFAAEGRYDRIVSVEMFEHLQNWPRLLGKLAGWLAPDGRLLVHHFCHRSVPYRFETEGTANWMGRYFFTDGIMPSRGLLQQIDGPLKVERTWLWSGLHYRRTCEAWLSRMDARRERVLSILSGAYGEDARRWFGRWRIFFLACGELFGFDDGTEWGVVHHRMRPRTE